VTVNAVNPGPVDMAMYRAAGPMHLAKIAEESKNVPAALRCGEPADVADFYHNSVRGTPSSGCWGRYLCEWGDRIPIP
jgi:NAD(P)-dependent dehydrogenase (short-subunit alcohol dehydrogenase family)